MPSHSLSRPRSILFGLALGLAPLLMPPLAAQTKPALPSGPVGTADTPDPDGLIGDPVRDGAVLAAIERYLAGDHATALAVIRPEAEAGHPRAMNVLADAYDSGRGVARDIQMALVWWERAADAGDRRAPMNIGIVHRDGETGAAPDHALARRWFARSAEMGYGPAMARLGHMLENGQGGAVDLPGALALYRQGQAEGSRWAYEYEAHLHRTGTGVPEDMARARALFTRGAELGLAQSMNNLGVMLRDGMGGPADPEGAEAQFRAASALGYALADLNLASFLAFGSEPARPAEALTFCEQARERDPALWADWLADCTTIAKWVQDS